MISVPRMTLCGASRRFACRHKGQTFNTQHSTFNIQHRRTGVAVLMSRKLSGMGQSQLMVILIGSLNWQWVPSERTRRWLPEKQETCPHPGPPRRGRRCCRVRRGWALLIGVGSGTLIFSIHNWLSKFPAILYGVRPYETTPPEPVAQSARRHVNRGLPYGGGHTAGTGAGRGH